MERKVSHPNPKISQKDALKGLYAHPSFVEGTKVLSIEKVAGRWVATIDEPENKKTAAPPPFVEDGPPKSPVGPDESNDESNGSDEPKPDEPKEDEGEGKIDIKEVFELVKAIADKVGVKPPGEEHGPEDELDEVLDEPVKPPAGPPHGGAPAAPGGGKPPARGPLRPGMAPPGTTPVGAPSFASVLKDKTVATFTVAEVTDAPLAECERQINDRYAEFGYRVNQMKEASTEDGKREVRALVSAR